MTLEEAIRLLDPETTGEAIAEIEYYNGFSGKTAAIQAITDACEIAVEAMGRQIPKKPKLEYIDYLDVDTKITHCPSCGNSYVDETEKYCSDCGQALDWSDEE